MKKLNGKINYVTIIAIILFIIAMILVVTIFSIVTHNKQAVKENSMFRIKELSLYSSADVKSNSTNQALQNLSISQFSDISIYIDNSSEDEPLNDMNTIKEIYIDNINIPAKMNNGRQILNYKSPMGFGKYSNLSQAVDNRINFLVMHTNDENDVNDYNNPTFYTDCSNPITLGYINQDIVPSYSISENTNAVSYNAKVLKEANINLEDISTTISFTIHLVNNLNHKFSCNVNVNLRFDEDFINNGYAYIRFPISEDEYRFVRE